MHKFFPSVLLLAICFICYGCPFGSPYALEPEPKERVKEELLGVWQKVIGEDSVSYSIEFEKKSELEYKIIIRGDLRNMIPTWSPSEDSIGLIAFPSTVNGHKFLNIQSQGQFYLVNVKHHDSILSLLPLSDRFNSNLIKNNQRMKEFVSDHMKTGRPMYDEQTSAHRLLRSGN